MKCITVLCGLLAFFWATMDLFAQVTFTNNNPTITVIPYGGSFTLSVGWAITTTRPNKVDVLLNGSSIFQMDQPFPVQYTLTYPIKGVDSVNDGYYQVRISDSYSYALNSAPVYLHVSPAILIQPQDTLCLAKSSTTMGIAAGPSAATFQWIDAATGTILWTQARFSPTVANNGQRIFCRISNSYGSVSSKSVLLTVVAPPAITSQPTNVVALLGSNARFNVTATGTTPLNYQWYKNGLPIQGANLNYIILPAVTLTDAGTFQVVISNAYGQTNSNDAVLKVVTLVSIATQPASLTVAQGQDASFRVSVSGSEPYSFQWTKNGATLTGATNSTLQLVNVDYSAQGVYAVRIANPYSQVLSSNATLTVVAPVPANIITQPTNQVVTIGSNATFFANALGTPPLNYQWLKNGTNLVTGGRIIGATSNALTLASAVVDDAGQYRVSVSNAYGTNTSSNASLIVVVPPAYLSIIRNASNSVILQVNGTPGFAYVLEALTNLNVPLNWRAINTNATDTNGIFSCIFSNTQLFPSVFFRTRMP